MFRPANAFLTTNTRVTMFPTTHATWLMDTIAVDPVSAHAHVMERYFEPLCAYARASSLRALGEPAELVSDFLTSRASDETYLARWLQAGMPLRRWLANGLLTHARNRAVSEARRRRLGAGIEPAELERLAVTHETDALLALERAWAVRTMAEAYESVRSELHAEGRAAWWELFRLHCVKGLPYTQACPATGIAPSNAANVQRSVVLRLRNALRMALERDGIGPDDIDRELALMQDFLG
jgi:DNA-directed RNA polymerase specialized sigma24 family protein